MDAEHYVLQYFAKRRNADNEWRKRKKETSEKLILTAVKRGKTCFSIAVHKHAKSVICSQAAGKSKPGCHS